jgi:hypothetical protein
MSDQAREQLLSCLETVKLDLEELGQVSSAVMVAQAVEEINSLVLRLGRVSDVLDRLYKNQITRDADAIGEISELFSDEEIARAVEKPFLNQESET